MVVAGDGSESPACLFRVAFLSAGIKKYMWSECKSSAFEAAQLVGVADGNRNKPIVLKTALVEYISVAFRISTLG